MGRVVNGGLGNPGISMTPWQEYQMERLGYKEADILEFDPATGRGRIRTSATGSKTISLGIGPQWVTPGREITLAETNPEYVKFLERTGQRHRWTKPISTTIVPAGSVITGGGAIQPTGGAPLPAPAPAVYDPNAPALQKYVAPPPAAPSPATAPNGKVVSSAPPPAPATVPPPGAEAEPEAGTGGGVPIWAWLIGGGVLIYAASRR